MSHIPIQNKIFPMNQPMSLNVLGCDGRKHVQKTFPKSELFRMYEGVGGSGCCRISLNDVKLTLNLSKPKFDSHN